MMSYVRGGGSKMTPKYRTLQGKNRTSVGGEGGSKMVANRRTSFMDVPSISELYSDASAIMDSLNCVVKIRNSLSKSLNHEIRDIREILL